MCTDSFFVVQVILSCLWNFSKVDYNTHTKCRFGFAYEGVIEIEDDLLLQVPSQELSMSSKFPIDYRGPSRTTNLET